MKTACVLLLMAACSRLGGDAPLPACTDSANNPLVWTVPEVRLVTTFPFSAEIRELLIAQMVDFNDRLFDATDGQIDVARISIYDDSYSVDTHGEGVAHVHDEWEKADLDPAAIAHGHQHPAYAEGAAHSRGTPVDPEHIHLARRVKGVDRTRRFGAILAHEFMHAYLGVADEYLGAGGIDAPCSGCPDRAKGAEGCLMAATSYDARELCRPDNHDVDRDTKQSIVNLESCWETAARMMKQHMGRALRIPCRAIPGPKRAPLVAVYVFDREGQHLMVKGAAIPLPGLSSLPGLPGAIGLTAGEHVHGHGVAKGTLGSGEKPATTATQKPRRPKPRAHSPARAH